MASRKEVLAEIQQGDIVKDYTKRDSKVSFLKGETGVAESAGGYKVNNELQLDTKDNPLVRQILEQG